MADSKKNSRWNAQKEALFLEVLQQTGNVTKATVKAGLDRSLVYRKRNSNQAFREKWQNAMDQALDYLEAYLWDKAMGKTIEMPGDTDGDAEGNADGDMGGRVVDEKIAIFLLKAHRPEIFGDGKKRQDLDVKTKGESPRSRLLLKLDKMTHKSPDEQ